MEPALLSHGGFFNGPFAALLSILPHYGAARLFRRAKVARSTLNRRVFHP